MFSYNWVSLQLMSLTWEGWLMLVIPSLESRVRKTPELKEAGLDYVEFEDNFGYLVCNLI